MNRFLSLFAFLLLISIPNYAQNFHQLSTSSNHLLEVNSQWENYLDKSSNTEIKFSSEEERIQFHLENVIQLLEKSPSPELTEIQLNHRLELLNELQFYAQKKQFPRNTTHSYRLPIFIDSENTHCAVGFLMQVSGNEKLALKINQEHKFSYVEDIKTEGVLEWANEFGFSIDELKLIQPTYYPDNTITPLQNGTNGPINKLYKDENRVIFLGEFDSLNNLPCLNIGSYEDDQFSCFGSGLNGIINGVCRSSSQYYYAAGFIQDGGNNYPVAKYSLQNNLWIYLQNPQRPNSVALNIESSSNNKIVITINHPTLENTQEIWHWNTVNWKLKATIYGKVNDIIRLNVNYELIFAGDFDSLNIHFENAPDSLINCYNIAKWENSNFGDPINNWSSLTSGNIENISSEVKVVEQFGDILYFGGGSSIDDEEPTIYLFSYFNNIFSPLLFSNSTNQSYVNSIEYNLSNIIYGGNISTSGNGKTGTHIGYYNPITNEDGPLGMLDNKPTGLAYYNNDLIVAGHFTSNFNFQELPYIGIINAPVSIDEYLFSNTIQASPNPFHDKINITGISSKFDYEIFDSSNKLVTTGSATNSIDNLDFLPKGFYVLRVIYGSEVSSFKLVK